jgi:predicted DNA-binding transcriptional regulator AlpA
MSKEPLLPRVYVVELSPAALEDIATALSPALAKAVAQVAKKRGRVSPAALSSREAAEFLGIGRSLFFEIRRDDPTFPAPARVGQRTLYLNTELLAWLERQRGPKCN